MKIPADMHRGFIHATKNFGNIEILDYQRNNIVKVRFVNTGYEMTSQSSNIRRGGLVDKLSPQVYGVGFMGCGKYSSKTMFEGVNVYFRWAAMIERCYSKNVSHSNRSYSDCTVCDEWHNFQNFAEWFVSNYPTDGGDYHLDKDMKSSSRVYSPENCAIIPAFINGMVAQAKEYVMISPSGERMEIYNMSEFCFKNGLCSAHMCAVSNGRLKQHKGWTKAEQPDNIKHNKKRDS